LLNQSAPRTFVPNSSEIFMSEKSPRITVPLSEDQKQFLGRLSEQEDRTVAATVRRMIAHEQRRQQSEGIAA
jgi:hypothetical protein